MPHTIDTLLALADAYAEYRDHSEYVHSRAALHAALTEALAPQAAQPVRGTLTPKGLADAVMELAELLGNDPETTKQIDPMAWGHLLVYAPAQPVREPLSELQIEKIFATCHVGRIYPQDNICGPRAMRITEARAIEKHHGIGDV